jgi:hypothetical protein
MEFLILAAKDIGINKAGKIWSSTLLITSCSEKEQEERSLDVTGHLAWWS